MENEYNKYLRILKGYLAREELSISLIQSCKSFFQTLGGPSYEPIKKEFHKLFLEKVKESKVSLSDDRIEQIYKMIVFGGGLILRDIAFIDDTGFTLLDQPSGFDLGDNYYISYTYCSDRYVWRSFFELTTYFLPNNFNISDEDLAKLRDEIYNVFVKYYGNCNFPERLGMSSGSDNYYDRFAISFDKEEVKKCLLNKEPFEVSVIGIVNGTTKLIKVGVTCDLSKDTFLTVHDVDDKMEYLSDIINKKDKDESTPESFSKGAMTYKNKDVKTSNN